MWAAASAQGLAGLWFEDQRHLPDELLHWTPAPTHPVLRLTEVQVNAYLNGQRQDFDLPLDLSHGTDFQRAVWNALRLIPVGQTQSYAGLGHLIGKPGASRAVGAAVGRNPLSVVVPCHRVLGAQGELTGYAGGLERKQALLRIEGVL